MEEFKQFALISLLAVLATEGIVEYLLGKFFSFFEVDEEYRNLILPLASGVVGIGYAFFYKLDLIALFFEGIDISWVGILSTGFIIGRGANFVSALVSSLYGWVRSRF